MRPLRTAAVVNPRAAGGKAAKAWPSISKRLGDVDTRYTTHPAHAIDLTRDLLTEGYERIIAVGGDGTVNEVVNGWFDRDTARRPNAVLAVVPMGTGGDFRRTLQLDTIDKSVEAIEHGQVRTIDAARMTYAAHDGATRTRYFINLTSFGMGGEVAVAAKNFLSPLSGKAAFLWATVRVFLGYRAKTVAVEVDGVQVAELPIMNIAVGNGRYHGGGMHVCPFAKLDDSQLDITVIEALGMFVLAKDIGVLYSDNLYVHPKIEHYRGRRIAARSNDRVAIEVDGEPLGTLPVEITVLPSALKIQTPA